MAYGAKGERNGVHKDGKHHHGMWMFDASWNGLTDVANSLGMTVTGLMTAIGNGKLVVAKADK